MGRETCAAETDEAGGADRLKEVLFGIDFGCCVVRLFHESVGLDGDGIHSSALGNSDGADLRDLTRDTCIDGCGDELVRVAYELPDLDGRPCVCGVDFARSTDFISAVLLFHVDGQYYAMHHSWFCTRSCDAGVIKAPLDEWAARGIVTMVDDVEVSPELVTSWIFEQTMTYDVVKVAIDDYRHTMFQRYLEEIGFSAKDGDVQRIRPSDIMRVVPLVDSVFAQHAIAWGDDPCLRWMTNNTKLEKAPNNNFKYGKIEHRSRKTDGFMALVAAMCAESAIPDEQEVSFMPVITF